MVSLTTFDKANHCHLHYALSESQLEDILKDDPFDASLGEDELFHDTYYSVGSSKGVHQLWLRRRRNISEKGEPIWTLTESWEERSGSSASLRLRRWSTPDSIEAKLSNERITFCKGRALEEQFPLFLKFRFYRREAESPSFGKIRVDETQYGITLNVSTSDPNQLEKVMEVADKRGLTSNSGPLDTKLRIYERGGYIPEHLYARRLDMLIDESDSDGDYEEWMEEWRAEAHALHVTPPVGSPKFEDKDPFVTYARKLFDEICGPNRRSEESSIT